MTISKIKRPPASDLLEKCKDEANTGDKSDKIDNSKDVFIKDDPQEAEQIKKLTGADSQGTQGLSRFQQKYPTAAKMMTEEEFEGIVETFRILLNWYVEENDVINQGGTI